jgi:hypothetical protein
MADNPAQTVPTGNGANPFAGSVLAMLVPGRPRCDSTDQSLARSRDRLSAGVTGSVEVVPSQRAVASAHEQYISSLYHYNFATISVIPALGLAESGMKQYFLR